MAVYDYLCRTCDRVVEVRATLSQKAAGLAPTCPTCGDGGLRRLFTPLATAGRATGSAVPAGGGCCGGGCGCG